MTKFTVHVMVKAPIPGRVKTRLQSALGRAGCARLAKRMLARTLEEVNAARVGSVRLWVAGWPGHPAILETCGRYRALQVLLQPVGDLGARMAYVVRQSLLQGRFPILVGTDCPALEAADIRQAAVALKNGADAVLGPASDGGYYLLALRRRMPVLFRGLEWGGDSVLAESERRLRQGGCRVIWLTGRRDMDVPSDLLGISPFSLAFGDGFQRLGEYRDDH